MVKPVSVPHAYVHFFTDGWNTAPTLATQYLQQMLEFVKKENYGELATIVGRYYTTDHDKQWEHIKLLWEDSLAVEAKAGRVMKVQLVWWKKNIVDEFLKSIIVNGSEGRLQGALNNVFVERPSHNICGRG